MCRRYEPPVCISYFIAEKKGENMCKENVSISIHYQTGKFVNIEIPWEDGANVNIEHKRMNPVPKNGLGFDVDALFRKRRVPEDEGMLFDDLT